MWSNDSPPANRRYFVVRNKDVQDPFRNIYFVKDTVSPWVLVFCGLMQCCSVYTLYLNMNTNYGICRFFYPSKYNRFVSAVCFIFSACVLSFLCINFAQLSLRKVFFIINCSRQFFICIVWQNSFCIQLRQQTSPLFIINVHMFAFLTVRFLL